MSILVRLLILGASTYGGALLPLVHLERSNVVVGALRAVTVLWPPSLYSSGMVRFIHGDFKPANVLWKQRSDAHVEATVPGPDGWPLLTDFGSAQAFSTMHPGRRPLSANDQIRTQGWTRGWAAPEVLDCEGRWQTIRSDMYSWAQTVKAISHRKQLPEGLDEICKACLASDAESRPESFAQIADDLESISHSDCIGWGTALWQRQQACFPSGARARRHSMILCKQGLQVLLSQRQRILHGAEDRG